MSNEVKDKELYKPFYKKVWYSLYKIEKYSELATEGFKKAIKYLMIMIMILTIVSSIVSVFVVRQEVNIISKYIDEKFPELTYKDGMLNVNSEEPIIYDQEKFGKLIIDTKIEGEEKNKYINESNQDETTIIILNDKIIIKEESMQNTIEYSYTDLFSQFDMNQFDKKGLVEFLTSSSIIDLYIKLFLVMFIYLFVINLVNALFNIIIISFIGYLATKILKLQIRYIAIFNMTVYALTLSIILDILYTVLGTIFNYTIGYFDIMYTLVGAIYAFAALFIIKSDTFKNQGEIQKIIEVEKQVKEETEEQENKETEKKEKKKEQTEDKQEKTDEGEPEQA